jgi:hypothetical protein
MLNRFSLWEWLGYVRHGNWPAARDLRRVGARPFVVGDRPVVHYVYEPDEAYRQFFARWFSLGQAYGLGILRPPNTIKRVPAPLVSALDVLERPIGSLPRFRGLGRFFVLDLERR